MCQDAYAGHPYLTPAYPQSVSKSLPHPLRIPGLRDPFKFRCHLTSLSRRHVLYNAVQEAMRCPFHMGQFSDHFLVTERGCMSTVQQPESDRVWSVEMNGINPIEQQE